MPCTLDMLRGSMLRRPRHVLRWPVHVSPPGPHQLWRVRHHLPTRRRLLRRTLLSTFYVLRQQRGMRLLLSGGCCSAVTARPQDGKASTHGRQPHRHDCQIPHDAWLPSRRAPRTRRGDFHSAPASRHGRQTRQEPEEGTQAGSPQMLKALRQVFRQQRLLRPRRPVRQNRPQPMPVQAWPRYLQTPGNLLSQRSGLLRPMRRSQDQFRSLRHLRRCMRGGRSLHRRHLHDLTTAPTQP